MAGLDFNTQPPTAMTLLPTMLGWEAFQSQCDAQGNLLFNTDGSRLFNKQQVMMPNGDSLLGNESSTSQGVQVYPMPGHANQYLLFSLGGNETYSQGYGPKGALYYSIIDMTLDNGLGAIVPGMKNILIDTLFSEHMIIVREGCKAWLVTHMGLEAAFRCYEITEQGINTTPVVSYSATSGTIFQYIRGEIVYDPVGKRIFLSTPDSTAYEGIFEMHDFDINTGIVSNPRLLDHHDVYYRLCLSPDATKLYATGTIAVGTAVLKQFDITQPTAQDIFNSAVTIHTVQGQYMHDMAIGPDSMIYGVPYTTADFLFRIAAPNMAGTACDFTFNAIQLAPGTETGSGISPQSFPRLSPPDIADEIYVHDSAFCSGVLTLFVPDSSYNNYTWSTGDTGTSISITQSGVYWVESVNDCKKRVDTFNIADFELIPQVHDTSICFSTTAILTAPVNLPNYLWSDGSTGSQITITQPGTYWVFATDFCMEAVDTFHVKFVDFDMNLPADTMICESIYITPSVSVDGATYLWQDGSTGNLYTATVSGIYWVQVTKDGCKLSDTMLIDHKGIIVNLGNDTMLCENVQLALRADIPDAAYLWQDGSTANQYIVTTAGSYSLQADNNICSASDTIEVGYEKCDCNFSIPSVFTPNADGKNDQFNPIIETTCPVSEYSFSIFNRFGECVFSATNRTDKWNGSYKGQLADVGVYMYMLQFKGAKGKTFTAKGDVTLLR